MTSHPPTLLLPLALFVPSVLGCSTDNDGGDPEFPECQDEQECGFLSVAWSIEDGLACADVGATEVKVEVAEPGGEPVATRFDCSAGSGLTPALAAGAYSVRLRLIGAGSDEPLSSTASATVTVDAGEIASLAGQFAVDVTRRGDACAAVAEAYCSALQACGAPCTESSVHGLCCEIDGTCGQLSPLTGSEISDCTQDLESASCSALSTLDIDADVASLDVCAAPIGQGPDAASLGQACSANTPCPVGYGCVSFDTSDSPFGFCTLSCDAGDDAACRNGYTGPGVPICAPAAGEFLCAILCGEENGGDFSCPGIMECRDGDDGDIDPDHCEN